MCTVDKRATSVNVPFVLAWNLAEGLQQRFHGLAGRAWTAEFECVSGAAEARGPTNLWNSTSVWQNHNMLQPLQLRIDSSPNNDQPGLERTNPNRP